jgi:hypothetical protein
MPHRARNWLVRAALGFCVVVAFCMAVAPSAAMAQSPPRVPVLGVLHPGPATARPAELGREALEPGLKELGWVPGQTIRVEHRYASKVEQLHEMAQDLVRLRPDVIIAFSRLMLSR